MECNTTHVVLSIHIGTISYEQFPYVSVGLLSESSI